MTATPRVRLDVWSDYVCPFCYLELPQLARLQEEFGDQLAIEWHAFELRPEPTPTLDPAGDYLRRTWDRAVYPMAAEYGMVLRLPPVQPVLTTSAAARQRPRRRISLATSCSPAPPASSAAATRSRSSAGRF